jgi:sigma-B regulation protein RsbU (phosphoserine phosphatase)
MTHAPNIPSLQGEVERLKSRTDDLSSLIEVSRIINSTLDLDQVLGLAMEKAQMVMRAQSSSIMLINEKTNLLECEVALGEVKDEVRKTIHLAKGQGLSGWVWEQQKPVIVADVSKDSRFYSGIDQHTGFKTHSILAAPLMAKDKIIGVAEVINRIDRKEFTEEDLNLFTTFCDQVALAIDNARMHRLAIEQERMRQQLESAQVIQQSFLPQFLPHSTDERYQIAAQYIPTISVGGDFYDAVELDHNQIGLLIGDVSGKGIPAALFMARLMSDFHFFAQQHNEPEQLLSLLNETLVERSRQGMFVTLQYAVIDTLTGEVTLSNGGHLPTIHVSAKDSSSHLLLVDEGAPLGIARDLSFDAKKVTLQPGDSLLFYTDGIIESQNQNREQFSLERLLACVCRKWKNPQQMIEQVIKELTAFSLNMPQHDDITALAFRWNG